MTSRIVPPTKRVDGVSVEVFPADKAESRTETKRLGGRRRRRTENAAKVMKQLHERASNHGNLV